jgi:NAD(P)-dependent dehydrogenase (short-subunit alcohol dehydrogenase family)
MDDGSNTKQQATSGLSRRQVLRAGAVSLAVAAATNVSSALANTLNPPAPATTVNPNGRFANKVVLITGATSGIGEATAREFAMEGAIVHFCGRRRELGTQVADSIRAAGGHASYQRADVRVARQVRSFVDTAVQQYGRIDIAFNNAGVFMTPAEVQDIPLENYLDHINTNLNGIFYAMKYEIPVMRQQSEGIIVNMASVSGHLGFSTTAHYCASKHGVIGLTKAAAIANAPHNIRINSLSPFAVDTPMLRESFAFQNLTYEAAAPTFRTPRIFTVTEMARAVMYLASPESSYISGMDLDVTGGQLA